MIISFIIIIIIFQVLDDDDDDDHHGDGDDDNDGCCKIIQMSRLAWTIQLHSFHFFDIERRDDILQDFRGFGRILWDSLGFFGVLWGLKPRFFGRFYGFFRILGRV